MDEAIKNQELDFRQKTQICSFFITFDSALVAFRSFRCFYHLSKHNKAVFGISLGSVRDCSGLRLPIFECSKP